MKISNGNNWTDLDLNKIETAGTTPRLTLTKLTKPNLMNYNVTSDLKHVTVVDVSKLRFYKQQVFLKVHFVAKKLIIVCII